ncbi:protocatechuate 3,4-dioxygenase subunit alpha [Phycicoccus sp. Soil803]|uniref:protocatechuate 3,4-dioxygenase subunit alpha n=1 Tax=Phycicoccus sp. Soil803 TaxID=1736415 RepID=UPI0007098593|nr:protocatechuate 3,4-dioxygenase subunit alpha [Phycicoccus sp. Soil803]KRF25972.1 protocatechuate 3,4-dioxygenase subunit alpha [Phycicoccus sp. Soil803]
MTGETPRRTPGQTVGPFFHYALPYVRGHELAPPTALGSIRLHGTVYDGQGAPIPDALLEIRQADASGQVPVVEGALRRDGMVFTGWGRAATDPGGRYAFTTVEPGQTRPGAASFFSLVVFARGLLDRLFTRIYLPEVDLHTDPVLSAVPEDRQGTLLAVRDPDGSLSFDVHLQGEQETVFLTFPGHGAR